MVATRSSTSSRSSARLRKPQNTCSVDDRMESSTEDTKEAEVVEAAMTEDAAAEGSNNEDAEVEPEPSKNDIGCKDCLQESGQAPIETHEVETEYDKPDRLGAYMKGFGKRV